MKLTYCLTILVAFAMFAEEPETARKSALAALENPVAPKALEADADFQIAIKVKHGHLRELFIGCAEGRTDGFDRRPRGAGLAAMFDEMAPPPGIGTGYTYLVSPDRRMQLYKDIRGPQPETPQWVLFAKPGDKPVTLSWDKSQIPAGKILYCAKWDGAATDVTEIVDCAKSASVTHDGFVYYRFWLAAAK